MSLWFPALFSFWVGENMTEQRQRDIFKQGKPLLQEDRNFLGTQPLDESAEIYLRDRLESEHKSAEGFLRKGHLESYLKIDPSASVFIKQRSY